MDKISGIIPGNSRITTVDLKASGNARTGSPSFGREVGRHRPAAAEDEDTVDNFNVRPKKTDPRAEIVSNLSNKFFSHKNDEEPVKATRYNQESQPETLVDADQPLDRVERPGREQSFANARATSEMRSPATAEAEELAVGQNLDVLA